MFEVILPLQVTGDPHDLAEEVERVVDELSKLESCKNELLDYAVSLDRGDSTVDFEITVKAQDAPEALSLAISCVRTAIHATGGATPGWDEGVVASTSQISYEVDSEEGMGVRPLVDA